MQNIKSVALIRQIEQGYSDGEIRGVARLCKKDKKFGLNLSLANLLPASSGEYLLCLENEKYQLNDLYGGFLFVITIITVVLLSLFGALSVAHL